MNREIPIKQLGHKGARMAMKVLEATLRDSTGTGSSRRLRHDKRIPGVVYGADKNVSVSIDSHNFEMKFKHVSENELIELRVGKDSYNVLIKDFQSDILKNMVTHLDFYQVELGKLLKTHVPIRLVGVAKGVKGGGIMEHPLHELEIECLPKDLPEFIEIDVESLDGGHALHVGDLDLTGDFKVLNSHDQVVAFIGHAKAVAVTEEEETEPVGEGAKA